MVASRCFLLRLQFTPKSPSPTPFLLSMNKALGRDAVLVIVPASAAVEARILQALRKATVRSKGKVRTEPNFFASEAVCLL